MERSGWAHNHVPVVADDKLIVELAVLILTEVHVDEDDDLVFGGIPVVGELVVLTTHHGITCRQLQITLAHWHVLAYLYPQLFLRQDDEQSLIMQYAHVAGHIIVRALGR